ncbi:MAG: hypothetical protein RRA45_04290 [Saccharolobus sp.]|jgi:C4-type Zn-finger protein|uniref:hypothetical protein n=1 Tax=Saccharolobus sp. TaxID=2100761 RepID=UPI0028CCD08C|nr:hypothetical protein [Saccharolobus sp.]MDT7861416.1 hypothetical protein [Saccharolobus sp.]
MNTVTCPKCKIKMDFIAESESTDGVKKIIRYYYRCPVCGTRILDSNIEAIRDMSRILIKISH